MTTNSPEAGMEGRGTWMCAYCNETMGNTHDKQECQGCGGRKTD